MSVPRKVQHKRGPNRWNAFLRQELQILNAGKLETSRPPFTHSTLTNPTHSCVQLLTALPEGVVRHKVGDNAVMSDLLERWNAMSEAERMAATEDKVREMASDREVRDGFSTSTPLSLLNDIRRTLAAIEKQVCTAS